MQTVKFFLLACFLYCLPFESHAQLPQRIDSPPTKKQLDTLGINVAKALRGDSLNKVFRDSMMKLLTAQKPKADSATACGCKPKIDGEVNSFGGWTLTFLPALLFVGLLIWLLNSKGLKDFSLKEALSENAYPTILVDNPQYNSTNLANAVLAAKENLDDLLPPTIEKTYLISKVTGVPPNAVTRFEPPPPNPSISRYIAFITSILTLVVALGVACFYIYHYVRTGCPPELTGISTLLIALGIGVMPYVVNKIAGAISKSNDDSN